MMSLGERIRAEREKMGLSREQFCKLEVVSWFLHKRNEGNLWKMNGQQVGEFIGGLFFS